MNKEKLDQRLREAAKVGARICTCGHPSSRHTTAYPGVPADEAKERHARGESWCSSCFCVEFRHVVDEAEKSASIIGRIAAQ